MREDVLSLRALGGDPVSEEYLKADLYRRVEALSDLPDTPLFFGRLDYAARLRAGTAASSRASGSTSAGGTCTTRRAIRSWSTGGRRCPGPSTGPARPTRWGWSCAAGSAFRAASSPRTRTRCSPASRARLAAAAVSRILIQEIERPRSGPMRDIVATIAPDQDDIVRAGPEHTLCVQGAPGTGKTAVGLHRIAYLLYAYPGRMTRGGVLVIGPNRAFLSYIRNVLPALGEVDVTQTTLADLLARVPVRARDSARAAQVKGDPRMAGVLHRALWAGLREPAEAVVVVRGSRRWRVGPGELAGLVGELRDRGVRYAAGREMLGHRIAHVILTRMEAAGETCDDRTHEAVRRTRPVRAAVDAIWPKADPVRLVLRLLSDRELLAQAAEGLLAEAEQQAISWDPAPRGPASARWSPADAVLVDEASDLIERTPSLAHVVLDEAQDLSPMECRAIGRRCATGSATVLGDLAQGTAPAAVGNWPGMLTQLGKAGAEVRVLQTGYRVPRQILDYANQLLGALAPGLAPAQSLRQDPDALTVRHTSADALPAALATAGAAALGDPGSTAVIAADDQVPSLTRMLGAAGVRHSLLDGSVDGLASGGLLVVPVTLAKGLEFDHVIVVEPGRIAAAEARGLHRLYVALTRAVSRLTVLHAEPLPECCASPPPTLHRAQPHSAPAPCRITIGSADPAPYMGSDRHWRWITCTGARLGGEFAP